MLIPAEFKTLIRRFHQDMMLDDLDEVELVRRLTSGLSDAERQVVRKFIGNLLSNKLDPEVLQRAWSETGSNWIIPDTEHLRNFLRLIRNSIET